MVNYVKFLRGTPAAYERLIEKDNDTLYFISEADAATGLLYLGNQLIAQGSAESAASALVDLSDVSIAEAKEQHVLVYDEIEGKWVNRKFTDLNAFVGTNGASHGVAGLVPVPTAEDLGKFLCADGTWKSVSDITVAADEKTIELVDGVLKLHGFDAANVGAYARISANGTLEWVVPSGESLEEIQSIVTGMQSDIATINGKIDALTAEHVTINGQVNDVAARLVVVETSVEDHEDRVSTLESQIRTKVEQAEYDTDMNEINADIDSLIDAFTWKTLS